MATLISAADIEPEEIEWLWGERIPRNMISLVAGKPNQGKGLFTVHVSAAVSRDESIRPGGGRVLFSAAEDDPARMTRPRLEAAGANLENVYLHRFQLPVDFRELESIVLNEGIDLVVMDPLNAHLSHGVSRTSDNIRKVLSPLTELMETANAGCIIVDHVNKNPPASGSLLDAIGGGGSGAPAAARVAFVLGVDPDDEDRRVLAQAKFNIGEKPPALAFEIDTEETVVGEMPYLLVDEEVEHFDPMRMFSKKQGAGKVGRPPDKRAAAAEWLTTYLAEAGEPVLSSTIQEDAKQYQMSAKTLRRAADDMGIVKAPKSGPRCKWWLPPEVCDLMGVPDALAADEEDVEEQTAAQTPGDDELTITDDDLAALLGDPPAEEVE